MGTVFETLGEFVFVKIENVTKLKKKKKDL